MENRPFGILPLSEGWEQIYKMGVLPLQHSVEGTGSELWGANKFIMVYDLVFKMCIQRDPYNYSEQIYHNYCRVSPLLNPEITLIVWVRPWKRMSPWARNNYGVQQQPQTRSSSPNSTLDGPDF